MSAISGPELQITDANNGLIMCSFAKHSQQQNTNVQKQRESTIMHSWNIVKVLVHDITANS